MREAKGAMKVGDKTLFMVEARKDLRTYDFSEYSSIQQEEEVILILGHL